MTLFQQTQLSDLWAIGSTGGLPDIIATWSDLVMLADLTGRVDPAAGFDGTGFWPVVVTTPAFDPAKRVLDGTIKLGSADPKAKTWAATASVRDLTADEIAANLASAKTNQASAVDAKRDAVLAAGFPYDFGDTPGAQVLQTRDQDATNWLTLQSTCLAAVTAGQGASQGVTIRTLANVNVPLTYANGLKVMLALAAWGAAVYANSWALKDKISAAVDEAATATIDLTTGWPTSG